MIYESNYVKNLDNFVPSLHVGVEEARGFYWVLNLVRLKHQYLFRELDCTIDVLFIIASAFFEMILWKNLISELLLSFKLS